MFPAPSRQFRASGAIEMDLPGYGHQRVVVIDALGHDPRQPITAANFASFPLAQVRLAITDGDLRHCSKHESTEGLEVRQRREHDWHDARADDAGELSLGCRKGEYLIRSFDQAACKSDALDLIAIQQPIRRAAPKYRFQLPGEIDGVADARVHALSSRRAMDMR